MNNKFRYRDFSSHGTLKSPQRSTSNKLKNDNFTKITEPRSHSKASFQRERSNNFQSKELDNKRMNASRDNRQPLIKEENNLSLHQTDHSLDRHAGKRLLDISRDKHKAVSVHNKTEEVQVQKIHQLLEMKKDILGSDLNKMHPVETRHKTNKPAVEELTDNKEKEIIRGAQNKKDFKLSFDEPGMLFRPVKNSQNHEKISQPDANKNTEKIASLSSISAASHQKNPNPRKGFDLVTLRSDFDRLDSMDIPVKSYRLQKGYQKLEDKTQPLQQVLKQIQVSSVKNAHDWDKSGRYNEEDSDTTGLRSQTEASMYNEYIASYTDRSKINGVLQKGQNNVKENLITQVKPRKQKIERPTRQIKPKSVASSVVVVQNAPKTNQAKPQPRKDTQEQSKKESKRVIGNQYGNKLRLSLQENTVVGMVPQEEVSQKPMTMKKQNSHNQSQPSLHVVEKKSPKNEIKGRAHTKASSTDLASPIKPLVSPNAQNLKEKVVHQNDPSVSSTARFQPSNEEEEDLEIINKTDFKRKQRPVSPLSHSVSQSTYAASPKSFVKRENPHFPQETRSPLKSHFPPGHQPIHSPNESHINIENRSPHPAPQYNNFMQPSYVIPSNQQAYPYYTPVNYIAPPSLQQAQIVYNPAPFYTTPPQVIYPGTGYPVPSYHAQVINPPQVIAYQHANVSSYPVYAAPIAHQNFVGNVVTPQIAQPGVTYANLAAYSGPLSHRGSKQEIKMPDQKLEKTEEKLSIKSEDLTTIIKVNEKSRVPSISDFHSTLFQSPKEFTDSNSQFLNMDSKDIGLTTQDKLSNSTERLSDDAVLSIRKSLDNVSRPQKILDKKEIYQKKNSSLEPQKVAQLHSIINPTENHNTQEKENFIPKKLKSPIQPKTKTEKIGKEIIKIEPPKTSDVVVEKPTKTTLPDSDLVMKKQNSSEQVQNEIKPWKMEFTINEKSPDNKSLKAGSGGRELTLAERFLQKKRNLVEKYEEEHSHRKETEVEKAHKPERTKEEILKQRKEMMKYKGPKLRHSIEGNEGEISARQHKGQGMGNNLILAPWENNTSGKKEPSSELLERLAFGVKAKVSKAEMKALTNKNYEMLPEIRKRKEEEKKKEEMKKRQEKVKELDKKLRGNKQIKALKNFG